MERKSYHLDDEDLDDDQKSLISYRKDEDDQIPQNILQSKEEVVSKKEVITKAIDTNNSIYAFKQ